MQVLKSSYVLSKFDGDLITTTSYIRFNASDLQCIHFFSYIVVSPEMREK